MKDNTFEKILGKRILEGRQRKRLSRQRLAAKSGLTYGYLAGVERGSCCISLVNFIRIYEALDNDREIFNCLDELVDIGSHKNSVKDERLEARREKKHLKYLKRIGQLIKNAREEKGLSQEELSRKIRIGQDRLAAVENGAPDKERDKILEKISKGLGVSLYCFFPAD